MATNNHLGLCLLRSVTRPQPTWGEEYLNSENKFGFHWSIMLSSLMYSTFGEFTGMFHLVSILLFTQQGN